MPIVDVLGTTDRRAPAHGSMVISRRQVLLGLAGLPAGLALASCTSGAPRPDPSGSTTTSRPPPTAPTTAPPAVDARAFAATAAAAIGLIATYEATIATYPTLRSGLASYAADHDVHLEALAERVAPPIITPPVTTATAPTSGPTGPTGSTAPIVPSVGTGSTAIPVPADPGAAREGLARAEQVAGEEAAMAARDARDGEAARLLASIAASRAVHALLLGVPA